MAKQYASRNIRGKLRVCSYLLGDMYLRHYVPETVSFDRPNLESMLKKYSSVYVKPDVGSLGIGICKIKRSAKGYVLMGLTGKRQWKELYQSVEALYECIARTNNRKLIIQQAIQLDQVNGRPYDIRVMVQRKPGGLWNCTGMLVKVGAAKKIVTNYYQGGSICTLTKLHDYLEVTAEEGMHREKSLEMTALRIARTLSAKRSGMHEMGIDFARDKSGKLWVLEVNSNHPQFHPLKQLDPQVYDKMMQYALSYGRRNAN